MDFLFTRPVATKAEFEENVTKVVRSFSGNSFCKLVDQGELTMGKYHQLLRGLFFQPFYGSSTFAIAGGNIDIYRSRLRDYLLHHAEEEKTHWEWILNDLKNTGYDGHDFTSALPSAATQSYIAFNYFIAMRAPIARLGIALMLETLGASYGKKYAEKICKSLKLKPQQATFFFGHGDTDVGHVKDLWEVLDASKPTPEEWAWMVHASAVGFSLYNNIYEEASR